MVRTFGMYPFLNAGPSWVWGDERNTVVFVGRFFMCSLC